MTTIFAPITSQQKSAVCIIRISGQDARKCLETLGIKNALKKNEIALHKIFDDDKIIDEALISFFESPNSYTGQDVAEISCHSSIFIIKKILKILSNVENTRLAEPGEFTKIAFLNGKIDLVQADAIPDLIAAETESQHKQAILQLEGNLGKIYEKWREDIIEIIAIIEAFIDFPDEDLPNNIIDDVLLKINNLCYEIIDHINDQHRGKKIKDGLKIAIIGSPNVGKSSLINLLANNDIAIVSETSGTTRDIISSHLEIAGVAVKILDTAGIRKTDDKIEAEGIKRALQNAKNADIKIVVMSVESAALEPEIINIIDEHTLILINKIDLLSTEFNDNVYFHQNKIKNINIQHSVINISITNKINIDKFFEALEKKVLEIIPSQSNPIITQERYRKFLENSLQILQSISFRKPIEIVAEDLRHAGCEIGKITGKVNVDEILDVIFSRFCIGK
jgi:tRNA modification GTPase